MSSPAHNHPLETLSPFLTGFINQMPFPFQEVQVYLMKDNLLHSQIIKALSLALDIEKEIQKNLCNITELINATIHIHNDIREIDESQPPKQNEEILKHNKKLILSGDFLFCHALSLIPKLKSKNAEIFLYQQIQKACLEHIDIHFKKRKTDKLSTTLPLLSACFMIVLFLKKKNLSKKHVRQFKRIAHFFTRAYLLTCQQPKLIKENNAQNKWKQKRMLKKIARFKQKLLDEKNFFIDPQQLTNYLPTV